jgi:hypothetical protein
MNGPSPASAAQLGFDLGDEKPPRSFVADPEEIRRELDAILQAARDATSEAPWDEPTFRYNKVVFPQMARWLPNDEATQLCFEFSQEIERIERLLAA